jgi:hypothetical protein
VDPKDKAVYLTGEFNKTVDFEGTSLTSAGRHDMFLIKLKLKRTI